MLPPRHVYSAIVKNHSGKDVKVTATYEIPTNTDGDKKEEIAEITIENGGEGRFEKKTLSLGTWSVVGNIIALRADGGENLTGPFVDGPTSDVVFTIDESFNVKKH